MKTRRIWCIPTGMDTTYLNLPIHDIGQRYATLRIIDPAAEVAMERSMRQYGQLTPLIVGCFENHRYEIVDGFKRFRAGIRLGYEEFAARDFPGNIRAAKAAMIQLNTKARSISDLEKALVIRSLHRDDELTQVEIAKLIDRHPSWVCRRLALVERLCDEVTENLKLGLINLTAGRELAKLPRGNQVNALKTVIKYNFTSDETARLVALLMKESGWCDQNILDFPIDILEDRHPPRPAGAKRLTFFDRLVKMQIWIDDAPQLEKLSSVQCKLLISAMDRIEDVFAQIRKQVEAG